MPVFNGERYIRKALDSLLAQVYKDFELIISDNASTDSTPLICKEYQSKDPRIKFFRQEAGIFAWKNYSFVLEKAKGDYFMWAACDDQWSTNCLEQWTDVLDRYPECGVVFSDYKMVNCHDNDRLLNTVGVAASGDKNMIANYIIRLVNLNPQILYGLYRRELISSVGVGNFDFAGLDITLKFSGSHSIKIVPDYLYVMGVKGDEYHPYSYTHKKLNRTAFLRSQAKYLIGTFGVIKAIPLFILLLIVMAKNKIHFWKY